MKKYISSILIIMILTVFCVVPCSASSVTDSTISDSVMASNQAAIDSMALPLQTAYIFVGDSRLDGLVLYTDFNKDEDIFSLSGTSRGYKYLANNAEKDIAAIKAKNPQIVNWYEVYTLGINDIGNIKKYISWYQNRAIENNVILVSVNPLEYHKHISNEDVLMFNVNLRSLNLPYIDSYEYLIKSGFSTADGTHYNKKTCKNIAAFLKSSARAIGQM